jgi:hypothetical protein
MNTCGAHSLTEHISAVLGSLCHYAMPSTVVREGDKLSDLQRRCVCVCVCVCVCSGV